MRYIVVTLIALLSIATATAKGDVVKVAVLADLHITPGNDNDKMMTRVVEQINAEDFDLVVVAGDITNSGSDSELKCAYNHLKRIKHRSIITHGNHETTWSTSGGKDFEKYFGHNGCITQKVGDYLFVAYPAGPFIKMADGTAQDGCRLKWIEKQMQRAGKRRIVSVCHYPLNNDITNRKQVTALMNKYRVSASICGHYHKPRLMNFDSIPGILSRSLMLSDKGSRSYGYSVLTFDKDSIFVSERLIDGSCCRQYAVHQYRDSSVNAIPCDPMPEPLYDGDFLSELIVEDNAAIYTAAQVSEDILYYANSAGEVKAYDTIKREVCWTYNFKDPIYSTPVLHKELIIVATLSDGIVALNRTNGKKVWQNKQSGCFIGNGVVDGDYLYIGSVGKMYKIDALSGNTIWSFNIGAEHPQGRATIADGKLIFGAWDTFLYCVDCKSGKELWRWSNGSKNKLLSPGHIIPRVAEGRVMVVAPDRYITNIDLETGEQIWRVKRRKVRESTGISPDGKTFYAKTMDGEMLAVPMVAESYTEDWIVDAGWGYDHSFCPLTVLDNVVYMANRRGKVAAIDKCGKLITTGKFADSAANDLRADEDGNIWISFIEGTIWKVSLKSIKCQQK
ncbi:MAG: PQQ-binding-like beta-propeller repeat protein [Alistipes sp.]|nr:PQQ-binding-like beta-propeller repeat protein [Alistipes sp.]